MEAGVIIFQIISLKGSIILTGIDVVIITDLSIISYSKQLLIFRLTTTSIKSPFIKYYELSGNRFVQSFESICKQYDQQVLESNPCFRLCHFNTMRMQLVMIVSWINTFACIWKYSIIIKVNSDTCSMSLSTSWYSSHLWLLKALLLYCIETSTNYKSLICAHFLRIDVSSGFNQFQHFGGLIRRQKAFSKQSCCRQFMLLP